MPITPSCPSRVRTTSPTGLLPPARGAATGGSASHSDNRKITGPAFWYEKDYRFRRGQTSMARLLHIKVRSPNPHFALAMNSKISPCLWFDHQAEEAARFYTSIFKDSKITAIARYPQA